MARPRPLAGGGVDEGGAPPPPASSSRHWEMRTSARASAEMKTLEASRPAGAELCDQRGAAAGDRVP